MQADGIQSIPRVKDSGDNLKEKGEVCPKRKSGTQNRKKPLMRGGSERRIHRKSGRGKHESEKLVTNFVKNRVQEGQFVSLPENSKVSRCHWKKGDRGLKIGSC